MTIYELLRTTFPYQKIKVMNTNGSILYSGLCRDVTIRFSWLCRYYTGIHAEDDYLVIDL